MRRPAGLAGIPVYWGAVQGNNALFDLGLRRGRRLSWPVISVGSLSAGGAGKTPVVIMLADLLGRHGVGVDVLSRGYGRGSGVVEKVDPAGTAAQFGDEPLEMAGRGLRVWVGANRFQAGEAAEAASGADPSVSVHLLDDGFQHRRLARDLDIVLLTLEDVADWMLPAGNLREPLSSLKRADVIVVRDDEPGVLATLDISRTRAEVWVIRRELVLPKDGLRKPFVFCGVARPKEFLRMVPGAAGTKIFPDHHAYRAEDFERMVEEARQVGADGVVTTAKDAVKITRTARQRMEEIGPLTVAELRVAVADEKRVWRRLERVLSKAG